MNLGFFMCHIYWSIIEKSSVLYTERNVPWQPLFVGWKLANEYGSGLAMRFCHPLSMSLVLHKQIVLIFSDSLKLFLKIVVFPFRVCFCRLTLVAESSLARFVTHGLAVCSNKRFGYYLFSGFPTQNKHGFVISKNSYQNLLWKGFSIRGLWIVENRGEQVTTPQNNKDEDISVFRKVNILIYWLTSVFWMAFPFFIR